jgi:ureidoglycolate hydrolase
MFELLLALGEVINTTEGKIQMNNQGTKKSYFCASEVQKYASSLVNSITFMQRIGIKRGQPHRYYDGEQKVQSATCSHCAQ